VTSLDAFLATWARARATFGEGTPQNGSPYDQSASLGELESELARAAPDRHWSGGAAEAYGKANTDHQRVLRRLSELDRQLAAQLDRSAGIVTSGRSELDALRAWVEEAAASVPGGQAGNWLMALLVKKGLIELADIVTRANSGLGAVGDDIATIGGEYQALGNDPRVRGGASEGPVLGQDPALDTEPERNRKENQIDAFRRVFGRDPVGDSDWLTAAALDPHSYDPKNRGVAPNIAAARIDPVPGQGVVRMNLFIPSERVWAPQIDVPPYDNNVGDNRGFSATAGPEDSRVTIYADFDNGIVVARQNPSINADTGDVRAGTPSIAAVQQSNGAVLIRYNAADPFSPGGEQLARASGISVNGTIGIAPSENGPPRVGGDDVTTFPALEIYSDRGGVTTPLVQEWPTFFDNAAGPLAGLPFDKDIGDPHVISSFNSVVPQVLSPTTPAPEVFESVPITPPMSIVPPGNFTPFGPVSAVPTVRVYTPLQGDEFLAGP
jgi:EspA/EspE family